MWVVVAACAGAIALSGCTDSVYYYARTTVGIDVSSSTAEQNADVTVGFKRRFVSLVPPGPRSSDGAGNDALSVLSCTRLTKEAFFEFNIDEAMATGDAATNWAGDEAVTGSAAFRDCFVDKGEGDQK
ncbi:hypothetical protein [Parvibaculum sp.]|uniref:hypothetical protein n=1 Tax=Parvibaculum sp. TaxID=2024848 RepID=UPI001DC978F9|nr:hypothetical protein [Parvibaculum sp.]MBX3489308.1 hypothetical protein [Parvibaculum sp.]MCW5726736.1 hypothetical protein [Parvibaculum sp.]